MAQVARDRLHRRRLPARLFVERGVVDRHRLVAAQIVAVGRDHDSLALKHLDVSRLDLLDPHAAGPFDVGPRGENPRHALKRALGGQDRVSRADRQDAGQHIADLDQPRSVHRRIDGNVRQVGRRALFERLVDPGPNAARSERKSRKLIRLFFSDGSLCSIVRAANNGFTRPNSTGSTTLTRYQPAPQAKQRQHRPTPPRSQRNDPMIQDRHNQQKAQDARPQNHERAADVDQLDLRARFRDLWSIKRS